MTTLRIAEDLAEADWPTRPTGLSTAAAAIPASVIWRRMEAWIAWRWGLRPATFIVEGGCGSWRAPLHPFNAATVESWGSGDAWETASLSACPLGGAKLGSAALYRFVGMLGLDDDPPEDVLEAYRRLAEYSADKSYLDGASSHTMELGGIRESFERAPIWLARALTYSGAADLLRPYRRAP